MMILCNSFSVRKKKPLLQLLLCSLSVIYTGCAGKDLYLVDKSTPESKRAQVIVSKGLTVTAVNDLPVKAKKNIFLESGAFRFKVREKYRLGVMVLPVRVGISAQAGSRYIIYRDKKKIYIGELSELPLTNAGQIKLD